MQKSEEKPISKAQATYESDMPLYPKLVKVHLDMVTDVFNHAIDRSVANTNRLLIKGAVGTMKEEETITKFENYTKQNQEDPQKLALEIAEAKVAALEAKLASLCKK